ncbi:MAG: ROK family protein [Eubacteriales bacterium]|nr:ROK family protein [Eubacteriales bacterium]
MNLEQTGKNIVDIQQMNRSLILRTILRKHRTTRVELSNLTGLNKATVTNIVGDLITWGAVREVGLIAGKSGRRSIEIELVAEQYVTIGVWLTRRHFMVGAFDIYGECLFSERFSVGLYSPIEDLISQMVDQIQRAEKRCQDKTILGVAVALPGPYIKREGRIALLTKRREWQRVDIAQRLRDELSMEVFTQHDADAAVMAEWCHAENMDASSSVLCIMVGHGLGGGIIEDGKIISGCLGVAGEIGHMSIRYDGPRCECGNFGCLEQYCSSFAIQRRIKELLKVYPNTECTEDIGLSEVIRLYKKDDPLATYVVDEVARYLGFGIASLVNLFNPKKIIIGDELSEAGEKFLDMIKCTVKERVLSEVYNNMEIKLSTLSDAVLQGICISLVEYVVKKPEMFIRNSQPQPEGD